jgi:hypothetical protein
MKRFLFSTANFPAHVDWGGLLETACLLRDRGHGVRRGGEPVPSSILNRVNIESLDMPVAFNKPEAVFLFIAPELQLAPRLLTGDKR